MAARVNTKFLIVLILIVVTAGAAIAAVYTIQLRSNGARFAREGDAAMARDDYPSALRFYARAVGKEPVNLEYSAKMADALSYIIPRTQDEARERYESKISLLKHEAVHHPLDASKHLALIEELAFVQRLVGLGSYSDLLAEAAEDMWRKLPESDPQRVKAKLYQGVALFAPEVQANRKPEDLERGETLLVEYLEAVPDDDLGWSTLVMGRLAQTDIARQANDTAEEERALAEVESTLATAESNVEDGMGVALARLGLYRYYRLFKKDRFDEAETVRLAQSIADRVAESDAHGALASRIAGSFESLRTIEGMPSATEIMAVHLEREPDDVDKRLFKANLHYNLNELDDATAEAESLLTMDAIPVSFLSQLQFELRRRAASLLVDIAARRWDVAEPDARPALVAGIREAKVRLEELVADPETNPLCIRARGKLAFVEGRFADAAAAFDQIFRTGRDADFETTVFYAVALERMNQLGAAIDRMNTALEARPNNVPVLLHLAGLLQRTGQYEGSLTHLDEALAIEPDNARAQAMRAALARQMRLSDTPSGPQGAIQIALEAAQDAAEGGEYGNARGVLRDALAANPKDSRLLLAAARVEMLDGNPDQAAVFVDRGLAEQPESNAFNNLKLRLENDDPIALIKEVIARSYEDQATRDAETLIGIVQYGGGQRERADRLEAEGKLEEARVARERADQCDVEEAAFVAKLKTTAPEHPRFVEYRFAVACDNEDWATAAEMVELAARENLDQASGAMYEGRLAVAKGDPATAAIAFQAAADRVPYSGRPWRFLGMAHVRLGNLSKALDAFDRSYQNNRNDVDTIRLYSELLVRMGKGTRALNVLREGRRLDARDIELREAWLNAEASFGDTALVLDERRRIYEASPQDKVNASALARLLGGLEPRRELVLDEDGREVYSSTRWEQLPSRSDRPGQLSRAKVLDELRAEWHRESDEILEALAAPEERGLDWYTLRAYTLRERGAVEEGIATLEAYAARPDLDDRTKLLAYLSLGTYLANLGRVDQSLIAFSKAQPYETDQLEADHAIGDMLFRNRRFEEAVPHLERVAARRESRLVELQLVESYIALERFSEARTRLAKVEQEGGADVSSIMLQASAVMGEGDRLWVDGKKTEAENKYEEHLLLVDRAAEVDPLNGLPYVLKAVNYFKRAVRLESPSYLEDALRALARADEVQLNLPRTMTTRADILMAQGNVRGAIAEMRRLLEQRPSSEQARQVLVQLELREGRADAAIELAEEAVEMNPASVTWREILGDLYGLRLGQLTQELALLAPGSRAIRPVQERMARLHAGIAAQYDMLLSVNPTPTRVLKRTEALLMKDPPQFAEAAQIIRKYPDQIAESPILRTVFARVLASSGQRDDALEEMRSAYRQLREMIADGRMSSRNITNWYVRLRYLFEPTQAAEIEKFVMALDAGELLPEEYHALSIVWRAAGPESLSHRVELLRKGIDVCPKGDQASKDDRAMELELYSALGVTFLAAERYEESIEAMEKVIERDPDNADVLNNLAYSIAVGRNDLDAALPLAAKAAELRPDSWSILDTLGYIHYLAKNYPEAERFLRRSSEAATTAINQFHLAQVYVAQKDFREAERHLVRASELNPDPKTRADITQLAADIRDSRGRP